MREKCGIFGVYAPGRDAARLVHTGLWTGIDLPRASDLVASTRSEEAIRRFISADSIGYLSYDGMIAATGLPESRLATSCFTAEYPLEVGEMLPEPLGG